MPQIKKDKMRIQSINQNNYQNRNVGFKMNYCIKSQMLKCPKIEMCPTVASKLKTEISRLVKIAREKAGKGNGAIAYSDEETIATFILDAQTYAKVEKANEQEQLAILSGILKGENSEIIPLDAQNICETTACSLHSITTNKD